MADDARILELEKEVVGLRINEAHLLATVEHLTKNQAEFTATMKDLNESITTLNAAMNKGKGALWLAGVIVTLISALTSIAATKLFGA